MTVGEFGEQLWTNNELARRYRGLVKKIDHTDNVNRLREHVYPVVYSGDTIGDTALDKFTLDHAWHVLVQPTLPPGSVRHNRTPSQSRYPTPSHLISVNSSAEANSNAPNPSEASRA